MLITEHSPYRTACEFQIFATLLKWPLAKISAIAEFAKHEADLPVPIGPILLTLPAEFCESSLHLQISQKFGPRTQGTGI